MEHDFLDRYSNLDSFIHRLDPRTRLLCIFAFILAVAATPPGAWQAFAFYLVLVVALILLSRVPLTFVLKRSLVIVPFVLVIALFIPFFKEGEVAGSYNIWGWELRVTYSGLLVLWSVVAKASLSILALVLLSSTTPLPKLLKGLEQLRVPAVFIMIISFMYRYLFVLIDEAMRLRRARDSRSFGGSWLWHLKTIGHMLGTLFLRSYERAERIYAAMLARGFQGPRRPVTALSFARGDLYFAAVFFVLLASGSVVLRFL